MSAIFVACTFPHFRVVNATPSIHKASEPMAYMPTIARRIVDSDTFTAARGKAIEMEDVKFHQCVRLSRFENDRTVSATLRAPHNAGCALTICNVDILYSTRWRV